MLFKLGGYTVGFFLLIISTAAMAAPKVGDKFGAWSFKCQATAANKTSCALSQTLVNKKTKRRVLRVVLSKQNKSNNHQLLVLAPLGIYIPSGVVATVDKGSSISLALATCSQQGCMARGAVSRQLLQKIKAGNNLNIKFSFNPKAKPVTLQASLKGISAGIKALN
ncbi:MAG: hypothetical protein COB22_08145 [Cycloclasticus sp.]|nr:MAG: hypothetical protein COB22_08145 [Cycloclasticus sp.]